MSSLAGKVLGRYYLLEQIGLGGVATVYKCVDLERDQNVAVKVLSSHLAATPQFKERFSREVKVLRALQHPHIVPILDFGEFDDQPFIVMPFYTAGTLSNRLQTGALTPVEAVRIVDQLAEALEFAHQQGIVHRDLKPSNILLDDDGNAFLSDFGFAHINDASLSLTGSGMIGTPAYMSPEQCKGDPIDPRSDQYSLGVLLHQLTTGRLPFNADTPMGIAIKHVNEPLPPPRTISPSLPEAVECVLVKAMAKDPAARFASVADLNAAFRAAMAGSVDPNGRLLPPIVLPDNPTVPLPRKELLSRMQAGSFWKRRRVAAAALLLTLVFGPLAWAMAGLPQAGLSLANGRSAAAFVTPTDLMATIFALSTDLARPTDGERLSAAEVGTAVAGTLIAQGVLPSGAVTDGSETGATATPTAPSVPGFTPRIPSRTPTNRPGGSGPSATSGPTPTPTPTLDGQPSPTSTRTPTPTRTATDDPARTPTPTTPPTDTPAPPTSTPAPPTDIPPDRCKRNEHHQYYCTPTPTPS